MYCIPHCDRWLSLSFVNGEGVDNLFNVGTAESVDSTTPQSTGNNIGNLLTLRDSLTRNNHRGVTLAAICPLAESLFVTIIKSHDGTILEVDLERIGLGIHCGV